MHYVQYILRFIKMKLNELSMWKFFLNYARIKQCKTLGIPFIKVGPYFDAEEYAQDRWKTISVIKRLTSLRKQDMCAPFLFLHVIRNWLLETEEASSRRRPHRRAGCPVPCCVPFLLAILTQACGAARLGGSGERHPLSILNLMLSMNAIWSQRKTKNWR